MTTVTLDTTTVRRWKRYLEYRPSGADWLPQVPEHWEVRKAQRIGRLLKGGGGNKADAVSEGVPCVRYGELYTTHGYSITACKTFVTPERAIDYTPIHYGDVLFAASGETLEEIGKSAVNLMRSSACCGGDLVILRPTIPTHAPFLGYALDCELAAAQKASMGRGTTVKHIYPDELKHLAVAVPPLAEQRAIAAFLDRETARIDALIGHKERPIALLEEKRQAVISHAVTRGLDPSAPLKDNGIPWLGMVPERWELRPLGYCVDVLGGMTPSKENIEYWRDETIPWVSPKDMKRPLLDDSEDHITDAAVEETRIARILPESVLVVVRGMILARDFPVAINTVPVTINQDMKALRPNAMLTSRYLAYQLRAIRDAFFSVLEESGHGTRCLRTELWKGLNIVVPPHQEQQSICGAIDNRTETITQTIDRIRDGIERLQE